LRLFSFGGYGLALAALALVVFGAIECSPHEGITGEGCNLINDTQMNGEISTEPFHMVVDRLIFQNIQIMLSPCFTSIPKTGLGLPKTRESFY